MEKKTPIINFEGVFVKKGISASTWQSLAPQAHGMIESLVQGTLNSISPHIDKTNPSLSTVQFTS